MKHKTPKKCLIKSCERSSVTRGLCTRCYTTAKKLIDDKRYTWDRLQNLGLVLPPHKKANPFLDALQDATKKTNARKR